MPKRLWSDGDRVRLRGTAHNGKAGALLLVDGETPVYMEGLTEWDRAQLGKRLSVEGVIAKKVIFPLIDPENPEISQGMSEAPWVLSGYVIK
jgi:hypothetical protein